MTHGVFQKKPAIVNAFLAPAKAVSDETNAFPSWLMDAMTDSRIMTHDTGWTVQTDTGDVVSWPKGWWLILGTKGELYPCDPEVFAEVYSTYDGESTAATQASQAIPGDLDLSYQVDSIKAAAPPAGSYWYHHSGTLYKVEEMANLDSKNESKFPLTVVYRNTETGSLHTKPLVTWLGRFNPRDAAATDRQLDVAQGVAQAHDFADADMSQTNVANNGRS